MFNFIKFAMIVLMQLLVISACTMLPASITRQTSFSREDINSEDPVIQIKAIKTIADKKDMEAGPDLAELLIHGDPTIRNTAYEALIKITGKSKPFPDAQEYKFYDDYENRANAAKAWKEYFLALQAGRAKMIEQND